jgi:hypothetical protein
MYLNIFITINNDLVSVVNIGLMKRANQDKLKELSKKNIPSQKMSLV